MVSTEDVGFMRRAYEQARKSFDEGGLPIGAVLVRAGRVIAVHVAGIKQAQGHNFGIKSGTLRQFLSAAGVALLPRIGDPRCLTCGHPFEGILEGGVLEADGDGSAAGGGGTRSWGRRRRRLSSV